MRLRSRPADVMFTGEVMERSDDFTGPVLAYCIEIPPTLNYSDDRVRENFSCQVAWVANIVVDARSMRAGTKEGCLCALRID